MRAKEIHAAVEALIGEPVKWSSVKQALASHVIGPSSRFLRIAREWIGPLGEHARYGRRVRHDHEKARC